MVTLAPRLFFKTMKKARYISVLIAALLSVAGFLSSGCSSSNAENAAETTDEATDTIDYDLRVAVLPTLEALPVYYAQQAGIFDSLGITVKILPYTAQFDCDTALFNNTADVCMMDRTRFADYTSKGYALASQLNIDTHYSLVASKEINAKRVRDLSNLTIAISRHSGAETYCLHELKAAGLKREDVHFPQINNVWLRADMLTNRQVDAAVLPRLQAIYAELNGHHLLKSNADIPEARMRLAYLSTSANIDKITLLAKAYELGKAQIANNGLGICRNIFIKEYKISAEQTDSIIKRLP